MTSRYVGEYGRVQFLTWHFAPACTVPMLAAGIESATRNLSVLPCGMFATVMECGQYTPPSLKMAEWLAHS